MVVTAQAKHQRETFDYLGKIEVVFPVSVGLHTHKKKLVPVNSTFEMKSPSEELLKKTGLQFRVSI